jgi:hypothetical protein
LWVAKREQFVPAISSLLADQARATRLAIAARGLAARQYDWKLIGERAADAALSICNLAHAQATGAPVMCPAAQTSQT